jgi:hypothetical protein
VETLEAEDFATALSRSGRNLYRLSRPVSTGESSSKGRWDHIIKDVLHLVGRSSSRDDTTFLTRVIDLCISLSCAAKMVDNVWAGKH